MGISNYFSWLVRHFEGDIIFDECPYEAIDNLFMDWNAGLHPAARSKPEASYEDMCHAIITYLEYLIDLVRPTKLLYIAIDGVAPLAKMSQQHTRRFKAVRETQDLNRLKKQYGQAFNADKQKDFNAISPATPFMSMISAQIYTFLNTHAGGKYRHLRVVFSDATRPQEGEHKILAEVKKLPPEEVTGIYGLDSDLIMLALSTNLPNIVLVRENNLLKNNHLDLDVDKYPQMAYFSINGLYQRLVGVMNPYTTLAELEGLKIFALDKHGDPEDQKASMHLIAKLHETDFFTRPEDMGRVIKDYIFISFFLGNDFVPAFEALKIREGGIELILRAYKKTIQKLGQYLLTPVYGINADFLIEFLVILSGQEEQALRRQKVGRDRRVKSKNPQLKPQNYKEAVDEYQAIEGLYKDTINVFASGWQDRYYQYFFHPQTNLDRNRQNHINQICVDYLRALHWITQYYFVGCPDWHWSYPHQATPLLSDFLTYVRTEIGGLNQVKFDLHAPLHPYYQLLTILPPQSVNLLPQPFHYLMLSDDSPLIHYFPTSFQTEYYGKRYRYEAHPMLPLIPPAELEHNLGHIHDQLSEEETKRGQLGELMIWN